MYSPCLKEAMLKSAKTPYLLYEINTHHLMHLTVHPSLFLCDGGRHTLESDVFLVLMLHVCGHLPMPLNPPK